MKQLALFVFLFAVGCAGEFEMTMDADVPPSIADNPAAVDTDGDGVPDTIAEELTPGFALRREEVRLLPFHVRIQKLTHVTGLAPNDPLFDQVWTARYDLGDHNYGQGIGPDLSWNASKMATWVRALRPVCTSEAMAQRFPALPENVDALFAAAYGRAASTEEVGEIQAAINAQNLDEAGRYESTCLAVLTSSEFVAQ